MKPLCIYHGHCDDGFAAAWVLSKAVSFFDFYAGQYQQEPPDVTGRHVVFVDFSYKRPVLLDMATKARSIIILDHHKTAAEDLAGFREPVPFAKWDRNVNPLVRGDAEPIACLFDMDRSGAGLAWDFFFAGKRRPLFIDYIEDRDLWRKQLPDGDLFTIALRSYPQDFKVWDALILRGVSPLIAEGRSIHRYYRLRVEELKRNAYLALLAGRSVWIVNAPYFVASELAGELAERDGGMFGACFHQFSNGKWGYSLRSRGEFDVSEIAKIYGGGGHKNAAGFTIDLPAHAILGAFSS